MLKNFINEENNSNESYETPFINLFPFEIQYNKPQELEELEVEYNKIYFIEKKDTKETSSIHENDSKALIFIITKEKEKEFCNEFLNRKKKTGREPKDPFNSKINKTQTRKFERDDILTKNQVHYFTYIIYVANVLLEKFGIKEKFMQIDYSFKKKVNFDYFLELREKKLVDIISMEITSKIKKQMKDYNKNLCEKIKQLNIPEINNFFELNYLFFFQNFYYKSEQKINLKKFGSKNDVYISFLDKNDKIITYQDKINSFADKNYAQTYQKFVEELYF